MEMSIQERLKTEMLQITVPEELNLKLRQRIGRGEAEDRNKKSHRKKSGNRFFPTAAAVLAGMMLGVGVLGAGYQLGLFDILSTRRGEVIEEERKAAQTYVQRNVAEVNLTETASQSLQEEIQEPEFRAHVREVYYDGITLMAVVNVGTEDPVALTMNDSGMEDPIPRFPFEKSEQLTSFYDYYKEKGYEVCYHLGVGIGGRKHSGYEFMEEDGSITFVVKEKYGEYQKDRAENITVSYRPYLETLSEITDRSRLSTDKDRTITIEIPVSLHVEEGENAVTTLSTNLLYPSAGVVVDQITMRKNDVEVYYDVEYRVAAEQDFLLTAEQIPAGEVPAEVVGMGGISSEPAGALNFEWIDPQIEQTGSGVEQRLMEGITGGMEMQSLGNDRYRVSGTIALSEIPEDGVFTLRAFSYETKQRYESNQIEIHLEER